MTEKKTTLMVVSAGPALRWAMEELKRTYGYGLCYATDAFDAVLRLENTKVDAVVCEAAPAYTPECKLMREIWQRSSDLPVVLFVEPESEEDLLDELGLGTFHVVRSGTPLGELHSTLEQAIRSRHRTTAA